MLEINNKRANGISKCGIISAMYFLLCIVFYPLSFGGIQIRLAEVLTILPLFFGEAVWGLTLGCLLSNFFGNGILDVIFGTLATLISAILTYFIGKKIKNPNIRFFIGAIPPVIINAFVIPLTFLLSVNLIEGYFVLVLQILVGQIISVYLFGTILNYSLNKIINKKIIL